MLFFLSIAHAAETATHEATGGIGSLGLDPKVLLFQVINFALLLLILRALAYRPILNLLNERKEKIAASLRTAQAIETKQAEILAHEHEQLAEAQRRSEVVLAESQKQAEIILNQAEARAEEQTKILLRESEQHIKNQIVEAREHLRREMLALVTKATEQVIGQKLDSTGDEALIRSAIKSVEEVRS